MTSLEHFRKIPLEKQNRIINAALSVFGTNGYRKTSGQDIADAAGISKAMLFYYFGTKKALYLYLLDLCGKTLMDGVNDKFDPRINDFFERIKLAGDIEMEILKKRPAIISFLDSATHESEAAVKADIQARMASEQAAAFQRNIAFNGIDMSKFKQGIDPKLIVKMLLWMSEGYFSDMTSKEHPDLEMFYRDYLNCLELLRKVCYREDKGDNES
ncbi:TetR/AcrR family transcriptional regulator [Sporolactobacillus sp. KGMB 08714]|uniref:TetR/AcrR family transcriptional regulator n=1 Tax=Sporolactobacillus sp. KGMB 08714 TaxID=3064704 RepID=UPI002FBECBB0